MREQKSPPKLPRALDHKVTSFYQFIIHLRKGHQFLLSHIVNLDETPLNFDMLGKKMVDLKGAKSVYVKSAVYEKTKYLMFYALIATTVK